MRWGKTTLRWVEYQQGRWPSQTQKAKQPHLEFSLQWWIQGRGLGVQPPPLFLDQLRPKGRKKNFKTAHHPPTPLSEGLDPPVVCMDICMYPFRGRASIFNFHYSVKYNGCVTNCVVQKFPFRYSAMIIIWYRIYNLNSYQLCWRQRFFTKKV